MSEERIVNRVQQSPAFYAEGTKLSEKLCLDCGVSVHEDINGRNLNQDDSFHVCTKLAKVGSAPVIEIPNEVIDPIVERAAKDLNWSMSPAAVEAGHEEGFPSDFDSTRIDPKAISDLLAVMKPLDADFKKQVIAAFRHLGLDTEEVLPGVT